MQKLLIATGNRGKLKEYQDMLQGLPLELVSLPDAGITTEVAEDGETFRENAALKALAYCRESGLLTLADDSGLEVEALGGEPGVRSARYAGEGASDTALFTRLLEKMQGIPLPEREARFRCVIAIAAPGMPPQFAEGECPGYIALAPAGEGGFGYDPVFYLPEFDKTMAEISAEEKNRISHRARAAAMALLLLEKIAKH